MKVSVKDCGGGRFEIQARDAVVAVDLLPADGGAADGFRSVELLLAGLGACTAGTMRTFAMNQQMAGFEGIDVVLTAETAEHPERVARIDLELRVKGAVSEPDLARLMRVGGRCKVHNTLHSDPVVEMKVADPADVAE